MSRDWPPLFPYFFSDAKMARDFGIIGLHEAIWIILIHFENMHLIRIIMSSRVYEVIGFPQTLYSKMRNISNTDISHRE